MRSKLTRCAGVGLFSIAATLIAACGGGGGSDPNPPPTIPPTTRPTTSPTTAPTMSPTIAPTAKPTASPTIRPTTSPTATPTTSPTASPTTSPTATPSPASTLVASPNSFSFDASSPTSTSFTVSEPGYNGTFSITQPVFCNDTYPSPQPSTDPFVAEISPASGATTFTVQSGAETGTCTATVTDSHGGQTTVQITVTGTSIIIFDKSRQ
jgi:hypothetical protein